MAYEAFLRHGETNGGTSGTSGGGLAVVFRRSAWSPFKWNPS
jgi:hypothetical protein